MKWAKRIKALDSIKLGIYSQFAYPNNNDEKKENNACNEEYYY